MLDWGVWGQGLGFKVFGDKVFSTVTSCSKVVSGASPLRLPGSKGLGFKGLGFRV